MGDTVKAKVLVVGPSATRSRGGMATVIEGIGGEPGLNAKYDVELYESYIDGGGVRRAAFSLWAYLRFLLTKRGYDIYHIHAASRGSTFRKLRYVMAAKRWGKGVILHVHGAGYREFFQGLNGRQRERIAELFGTADTVIVLSEEWRDWFSANVCGTERLAVLHNAVAVPEPVERDWAGRRVLFMGRVGERKGVDVLLRALPSVLAEFPDARFIVAGDGEVERYRALARELGVEGACEFPGWVSGEARERLYRGCTAYCLPSRNEGMPMSVLEAMAWGLPAVATPVGGVPQVIEDGANGYLVPAGDADALAERIIALLADSDLRARIGAAGRATIEERFSMAAYGERLGAIYEGVLG